MPNSIIFLNLFSSSFLYMYIPITTKSFPGKNWTQWFNFHFWKYVTSYRSTLQFTSNSSAPSSTRWCITYRSFLIRKMMHLFSCLLFFFRCGNETFLCGDSELKARKGFWFTVTYGVILPWWVPKLRNVGKIPQQSCRILSHVLWFVHGACNRWCFLFQELKYVLNI